MPKKYQQKSIRFHFLRVFIVLAITLAMALILLNVRPAEIKPLLGNPEPSASYSDFHLLIPSLNIDAPVIPNVDGSDKVAYDKALENGVAQLNGSSLPGEGSNIFIFGHSSYYWWKPGEYKTIFSKLPDIKNGDEIIVWYNQKEHKYKVSSTQTVLPKQIDVTQKTTTEQLTLMTCVPVGTNQKRLIVIAKPE